MDSTDILEILNQLKTHFIETQTEVKKLKQNLNHQKTAQF